MLILWTHPRRFVLSFLQKHNKEHFDIVICFSITMWIHLNYGDEGLNTFLQKICLQGKDIILEPQPWICYKNACKRQKKVGAPIPELFSSLNVRNNVEDHIVSFITTECKPTMMFQQILGETEWKRKVIHFRKECT